MKTIEVIDRSGEKVNLLIELGSDSLRYTPRSKNIKTGNIPTQWIGASRDESKATCTPCPLFKDGTCYSQYGTPAIGHVNLNKVDIGKRTLEQSLSKRADTAKYARLGAIGDPGSIEASVYADHEKTIRNSGLGALSYTHHWFLPHAEHLKGHALASADNMTDVQDALADGWRVAVHVDENDACFNGQTIKEAPQGKIGGKKYFLCPAQRESKTTCNTCGLCDGQRKTNVDVIVFVEHGSTMKYKKARDLKTL